jgi:DtxR family Mn-dependent transcriptional regulator
MSTVEQARTPAVEDYCKAIYTLESRAEQPVSTNALAERLEITPGSVSAMLKKLGELGFITHVPYRGVRLTEEGRRVALEVIRHHRLLELFLAETLEMPWDRVHAEAEVLEHVISEELEQLIATKLGDPTLDPHGDPIPSAELELRERETVSLDSLEAGERGVFVRVSDADPKMLRYLAERGISPGERMEVRERQPFGGPLTVSFEGGEPREHALGGALARAMRVELDGGRAPDGVGGLDRKRAPEGGGGLDREQPPDPNGEGSTA